MTISKMTMMCSALLLAGLAAYAAEEKAAFKATCPVSGKPALEDKTAEYKGAKVYFCCENCPTAFAKDTSKFAAPRLPSAATTAKAKLKPPRATRKPSWCSATQLSPRASKSRNPSNLK